VIDKLIIKLPWRNLSKQPVVVIVKDVFILAKPSVDRATMAETQEVTKNQKKEKIAEYEDLLNQKDSRVDQKIDELKAKFARKLFANLQLTIENFHLRYEDEVSNPSNPCSVGLTVARVSAVTTNGSWEPAFAKPQAEEVFKLLRVESLAMYWNSTLRWTSFESLPAEDFKAAFRGLVSREGSGDPPCEYAMRPVSIACRLTLNTNLATTRGSPKIDAKIEVGKVFMEFRAEQHHSLLYITCLLTDLVKRARYLKFDPPQGVRPTSSEESRAWWGYAQRCILGEIQERNRQWTWGHFKARRDARLRYVALYRQRQLGKKNKKQTQQDLEELEAGLPLGDLLAYRTQVDGQIAKEKQDKQDKIEQDQQKRRQDLIAWFKRGRNTGADDASSEKAEAEQETETNEELQEEIRSLESLGSLTELVAEIGKFPADYTWFQLGLTIQTVVVSFIGLKPRPVQEGQKEVPFVRVIFDSAQLAFYQQPSSHVLSAQLQTMRVEDAQGKVMFSKLKSAFGDQNMDMMPVFIGTHQTSTPDQVDLGRVVDLKLQGVFVMYDIPLVNQLLNFFAPPIDQDSLMKLKLVASVPLRNVEKLMWESLDYFFTKREKLELNIDIRGPIFCVTDKSLKPQPYMMTHFGSLLIKSHRRDVLQPRGSLPQSESTTSLGASRGNNYDRFSIMSQNFQFLVGSSFEEVFRGLNSAEVTPQHVFLPTSFELEMINYRDEESQNAGTFTIIGNSPGVTLRTTEWQYRAALFLTNELLNGLVKPVKNISSSSSLPHLFLLPPHFTWKFFLFLLMTVGGAQKPARVCVKLCRRDRHWNLALQKAEHEEEEDLGPPHRRVSHPHPQGRSVPSSRRAGGR